jgi:fructose 1,6-bisphosphatase
VVQPYGTPPYVAGAMRGSHHGVFYPVRSDESEVPSYYDGPPLIKAVGMVLNDGEFSVPVYPFDASFWDSVRDEAAAEFRQFRERQGSFGPGTVEAEELEYGGWAEVVDALDERFEVSPAAAETGAAEADDD